jgi:hypothetical protein
MMHEPADDRFSLQIVVSVVVIALGSYRAVEALDDAIRVGYQLQLVLNLKRQLPSRSRTLFTPGVERSLFS